MFPRGNVYVLDELYKQNWTGFYAGCLYEMQRLSNQGPIPLTHTGE